MIHLILPSNSHCLEKEMLEMMIPHPPLQKKDSAEKVIHRKSSPRKMVAPEEVHAGDHVPEKRRGSKKREKSPNSEEKSGGHREQSTTTSQRHVEGIRQFHEQR